jgi:hypothetical protein
MTTEEEPWQLAGFNRLSEAYSRLVELDSTRPNRPESALQLYWLLALNPELDSIRSRHEWLATALTRSRLSTPALELYKRELEANPEAGLSEPYNKMLEIEASSENLLGIASQRLAAAGLRRSWHVIESDLTILSDREHNAEAWLSFLLGVLAHLCFDRPTPVYEQCLHRLADLRYLEFRESRLFDQIEELQQRAKFWRAATDLPVAVMEVVRDAWVGPATAWKKTMIRAAEWTADDPAVALEKFDQSARTPACRPVFSTFQSLLNDCRPLRLSAYPHGLIRGLVREFLVKNGGESYSAMRPELIRFLVRDAIDPHELVRACVVDSALGPRALVEHVRTDPTLRMVWQTVYATQG